MAISSARAHTTELFARDWLDGVESRFPYLFAEQGVERSEIERATERYLDSSGSGHGEQTDLRKLLESPEMKKLTPFEQVQVINVRPEREVDIYMILNEDRLNEDEAQSLVDQVRRFWAAPPKKEQ